jgi:general stress protein CsbA
MTVNRWVGVTLQVTTRIAVEILFPLIASNRWVTSLL